MEVYSRIARYLPRGENLGAVRERLPLGVYELTPPDRPTAVISTAIIRFSGCQGAVVH